MPKFDIQQVCNAITQPPRFLNLLLRLSVNSQSYHVVSKLWMTINAYESGDNYVSCFNVVKNLVKAEDVSVEQI